MKGIGAVAGGLAALGVTGPVQANSEDDLEWTANNIMEGDNTVCASLDVGYYGSHYPRDGLTDNSRSGGSTFWR